MDVAVVGLGTMGRNHVRVLRELTEVREVFGVDPDPAARADITRRYRVTTVATLEELGAFNVDAAVVASPSAFHAEHGCTLFKHGIPTLIEKPLANSVNDAKRLLDAQGDVIATVGHVERFNPAVIGVRERISSVGRTLAFSTRRVGPYPQRIRDVGVLLDLLTHDLDAIRYLSGAEIVELEGIANRSLGPNEDLVFAIGRTSSGAAINMEAGWLSPAKIRELRVIGEDGSLRGDTLLQEVWLEENSIGAGDWEALATFRGIGEGNVTRFAIRREEPLRAELRNFLAAVRGEDAHLVSLEDGLAVVELASSLLPPAIAIAA